MYRKYKYRWLVFVKSELKAADLMNPQLFTGKLHVVFLPSVLYSKTEAFASAVVSSTQYELQI
jgi:hypothetical protein